MAQRFIIMAFSIIFSLIMFGQEPISQKDKLNEAKEAYNNGDYETASSLFKYIWAKYEDYEALASLKKCNECKKLLLEGLEAEGNQDYTSAIYKYNGILNINPEDKSVWVLIQKCKERQYDMILERADLYYKEGNYKLASETYIDYYQSSGKSSELLSKNIKECLKISSDAKEALDKGEYNKAKEYYLFLVNRNPTDVESAKALAYINEKTQKIIKIKIGNDQIEKINNKFSLKPLYNRFNMYLFSGFMPLLIIGGGISFNYSYFNLGLDVGGCESNNIKKGRLYKDNEGKIVKDAKGNFVEGKVQFVITPGINLKYFSIGLGLGTLLTKELTKIQYDDIFEYYQGTEINKAHFTLRPTIIGYIPFNKDFSGGMDIILGYNIINRLKQYNQFLVGIGFFF